MNIINLKTGCIGLILFFVTGLAHAQLLVANPDVFGVPFGQPLQVKDPGVIKNDTYDNLPAADEGATVEVMTVTPVANGTLSCPDIPAEELCADGSFEYTPGPGFSGTDSFTYRVVVGAESDIATVTLTDCTEVSPQKFSCWQDSSYRAKLTELGYGTFLESFEGIEWDGVRSTFDTTNSASEIISQGISWTSNHPTTTITTGTGPALTGMYGAYDPDHGVATGSLAECNVDTPPPQCLFHDGLSGEIVPGGDSLHGVGGYITGITGANIAIILDGTTQVNVGALPDPGFHFLGLIDATGSGFTGFEFRELDGKVGQERLIFGDHFIIASSGLLPENTAPVADAGLDQTLTVGATVSLDGSGSNDVDGDILTYAWSLTTKPAGSTAVLSDTTAKKPTFVADLVGIYTAQLIVNDGLLNSAADTVNINSLASCNVNTFSSVTATSAASYEACEILVVGPSFTAETGASITLSSGWEIWLMPGFSINQGATLNTNVCGQSLCLLSTTPMPYGCHSCVDMICAGDAHCCDTEFDQACLDQVATVCGLGCE